MLRDAIVKFTRELSARLVIRGVSADGIRVNDESYAESIALTAEVVIDDDEAPDARTAIMIGLAQTCGALGAVYDRKTRRGLKGRIEALTEEALAAGATKDAVDAIQTAIIVSTMIS